MIGKRFEPRSNINLIEKDHLGDWCFEKDCCLATNISTTCSEDILTLKMASVQVFGTSIASNSPSQDSSHPDDLFQ